ncbi:DUF2652 domain-containing protein [Flammeovirga pacifica]|uniref:DUF2652 domain-containing protein n=1 Tax=Flammeovirga pacifica TaxID=915059 RepID=A0A1S1YTC6_FLAPC|nr:DUF2652 domain-containing protein [Flammeovirga pacifica]OHX64269.1 hypothetical protein NH26_21955 [Flammeovirga pacifica]
MKALLFLPDISGFTDFIQNTEIEHSQHVIQELLDVLIQSNIENMELAEVEGDALFFYKEELPSYENLLAQVEHMYTAFYSHLELLRKNRVCPCNACSKAPQLELKIIIHCGEIKYLTLQNKRKPFGKEVIQLHRLLKNSVESDNYVIMTSSLIEAYQINKEESSSLFDFQDGVDTYDNQEIDYLYTKINKQNLTLKPYAFAYKVDLKSSPTFKVTLPINAPLIDVMEHITNYKYRHEWAEGVDKYEYNEDEVTRLGTKHVCVINGDHLNFTTITKDVNEEGVEVYGEMTDTAPVAKKIYTFYLFKKLSDFKTHLTIEVHLQPKNFLNKLAIFFLIKRIFKRNTFKNLGKLKLLLESIDK